MRACRRVIVALLAAAALSGTASAAADTVHASSGGLAATLRAGTHHPAANAAWWVSVTATLNGRPVQGAHAYYQFVYQGQVVSTSYVKYNRKFTFNGHFSDPLTFPARSEGIALVVRVAITAGGRSVYLPYAVQVTP
jgi:hypothetical protein